MKNPTQKLIIFSIAACVLIVGILQFSTSKTIPQAPTSQTSKLQTEPEPIRPKGFDQENDLAGFWRVFGGLNLAVIIAISSLFVFYKSPTNHKIH
jgi:hypothetical protein